VRKTRKRRPENKPNRPVPSQNNGHKSGASTVLLTKDSVKTKTSNTVDNLNKLLDADNLDSDNDNDFEYVEVDEKSNRSRKIWLMLVGLVVLGWLIAQAFNGFKQYQVKDMPMQQAVNTEPTPTPSATPQNKSNEYQLNSDNQGLSEKESYFDLSKLAYEKVVTDYIGANGQRIYMDAIKEQSKGRSAYRILLQKQATIIKQHEMLISKNESLSVANADVMKLIGISLDAQSVLNALQRLCQSKNVCDGTQSFNDFTVPSADALVNLRMYQNEEITEFTRGQEFQVRKQIIEESARKQPKVEPKETKATKAPVNEKGGNKANNNNADIQRAN
jgi:hypothetical protein